MPRHIVLRIRPHSNVNINADTPSLFVEIPDHRVCNSREHLRDSIDFDEKIAKLFVFSGIHNTP